MKKIFLLFVIAVTVILPQNAVDYFPQAKGYMWKYKNIPLDSLGQPVDSLTFYRIDSLAFVQDYLGKQARYVMSKSGPLGTILSQPYLDTNHVHLEGSNIWNYIDGLPGLDSFNIGGFLSSFAGWYSTYRLAQSTLLAYTIMTKDTLLTLDSLTFTLIIETTGRRLNDQTIQTEIGSFNCKKFLIRPQVKIQLQGIPIAIPIATLNDTVWIAPQHYLVKEYRASSNVDLSLFGFPSFFIPGMKTDILEEITVPVELTLFTASVENNSVLLKWETASEVNNRGFEVEKQAGNLEWMTLGFVKGNGTTTEKHNYSFNDNNLDAGKYYYRLKQIDYNGSYEYSGIVEVEINNFPDEFILYQNYPNPFNPTTKIKYSVSSPQSTVLKVYDVLGNEVAALVNEFKEPGNYEVEFSSEDLASGIYIYKLSAGKFHLQRKMLLIK